jgi:hypothetical protein
VLETGKENADASVYKDLPLELYFMIVEIFFKGK